MAKKCIGCGVTDMSAEEIAEEAMKIAGSICIYTNSNISVEKI